MWEEGKNRAVHGKNDNQMPTLRSPQGIPTELSDFHRNSGKAHTQDELIVLFLGQTLISFTSIFLVSWSDIFSSSFSLITTDGFWHTIHQLSLNTLQANTEATNQTWSNSIAGCWWGRWLHKEHCIFCRSSVCKQGNLAVEAEFSRATSNTSPDFQSTSTHWTCLDDWEFHAPHCIHTARSHSTAHPKAS